MTTSSISCPSLLSSRRLSLNVSSSCTAMFLVLFEDGHLLDCSRKSGDRVGSGAGGYSLTGSHIMTSIFSLFRGLMLSALHPVTTLRSQTITNLLGKDGITWPAA